MLLTLINWRWDYLTTWSTVCHSHFGKVIFNEWNNLDSFKSAKQQCWCMKMNINSGKSSDIEKIMQKTTIKIEITIHTKAYNFSYHHIWYYSLDCTTNSMRKSESGVCCNKISCVSKSIDTQNTNRIDCLQRKIQFKREPFPSDYPHFFSHVH